MQTAIDTSILVDILIEDDRYGRSSRVSLERASEEGSLIVCEAVVAELGPILSNDDLRKFLEDLEIGFSPLNFESAVLAGAMLGKYFERGGKRGRVVADFLVGAHAHLQADRLLTRDRGFYRDYFKGLKYFGG